MNLLSSLGFDEILASTPFPKFATKPFTISVLPSFVVLLQLDQYNAFPTPCLVWSILFVPVI